MDTKTAWKRVLRGIIHNINLNFHRLVGGATSPVKVKCFSLSISIPPSSFSLYQAGGRNHDLFCPSKLFIAYLFL
jgi:hypothetical protein